MAGQTKSDATKAALANALFEQLQNKRLDEICVKELVERCGMSRQTFYYHFQDIYEVIAWKLQKVGQELKNQHREIGKREAIEIALGIMRKNKRVILNIYRALERTYVERYFTRWVRPLVVEVVEEQARGYRISDDALEFVVDMYTFGVVNILLNWLDHGMKNGPVQRLDYFCACVDGGLEDALRRLSF